MIMLCTPVNTVAAPTIENRFSIELLNSTGVHIMALMSWIVLSFETIDEYMSALMKRKRQPRPTEVVRKSQPFNMYVQRNSASITSTPKKMNRKRTNVVLTSDNK